VAGGGQVVVNLYLSGTALYKYNGITSIRDTSLRSLVS
jgi:hypothetical protein